VGVSGFDAGRRALFETEAAELYERIVAEGGLAEGDSSIAEDGPAREAFELLDEVGLVAREEGRWLPVDPAAVQSQIVAPLGQQGAELINESASWARAFNALSQSWRRSPAAIRGPFTEVRGDQINPFIGAIVADAQEELITAQPQGGRSGRGIPAAIQRDTEALERGVRLRTLYQHSARRSRITSEYVAEVSRRGAEVRTLDEFFKRLIVVDRRIAVIPGHEGMSVALVIREPSMVAYLVDMFERSWERGRAFTDHETSMVRDIAEEQRAMTIRMLVEGHPDQTSAKRLGVSRATFYAYFPRARTRAHARPREPRGRAGTAARHHRGYPRARVRG
jgi:hypothetical protein